MSESAVPVKARLCPLALLAMASSVAIYIPMLSTTVPPVLTIVFPFIAIGFARSAIKRIKASGGTLRGIILSRIAMTIAWIEIVLITIFNRVLRGRCSQECHAQINFNAEGM